MEPIKTIQGIAMPMRRPDLDTDAIIPKQFLKSILRTGFGKNLFNDWRYIDGDESRPDPDFVLNLPRYKGAKILIGVGTFGIGSSREAAPWALLDYGIRCVIAPGFGDIFFNNSQKNGLLLCKVEPAQADQLIAEIEANPGLELKVDLAEQVIASPKGSAIPFSIDAETKSRLREGLDDIGITLKHEAEIGAFEKARGSSRAWL